MRNIPALIGVPMKLDYLHSGMLAMVDGFSGEVVFEPSEETCNFAKWGVSTYSGNVALINNYILPTIGDTKLAGINTHFIEKYYKDLLKMPAVKWDMMKKNPAVDATVPKAKKQEREIWTAEMLMQALEACDNKMLKIAFHLAFTATLRIGELLGLT